MINQSSTTYNCNKIRQVHLKWAQKKFKFKKKLKLPISTIWVCLILNQSILNMLLLNPQNIQMVSIQLIESLSRNITLDLKKLKKNQIVVKLKRLISQAFKHKHSDSQLQSLHLVNQPFLINKIKVIIVQVISQEVEFQKSCKISFLSKRKWIPKLLVLKLF